ncbi:hypothetical protein AWM75_00785 [Aerococcus urinaehominis]|uniref:Uncharacterized protein n=1 Tax=Aerococcus urinaehominis TaxID=128944 RepID=A0A0X8FL39_9LACT|nr:hypothetical protein [Aerococcus urinaehominis]AMB98617.1 hypothetical protein AWM75_00785 [Aerococcus urinaehominis]SDL95419.1 hypothetical protein SAMN04487985_10315 [Aerococcus urinaehominis]
MIAALRKITGHLFVLWLWVIAIPILCSYFFNSFGYSNAFLQTINQTLNTSTEAIYQVNHWAYWISILSLIYFGGRLIRLYQRTKP